MVEGDVPALGSSDRAALVHPGRLVDLVHLADGCVDHRQHEKHLACGLQLTVNQKSGNRHHQAGEQVHTSMEKQPNGKQNRRHSRNAQDNLLQHIVGDTLAFQLEVFLLCLLNGFIHSLFSRPAATECPHYAHALYVFQRSVHKGSLGMDAFWGKLPGLFQQPRVDPEEEKGTRQKY